MSETKFFHNSERNVSLAGTPAQLRRPSPAAIIFLGPPGAGKGTQAQQVAKEYSLPLIATGDVFRAHVANKTELGTQASEVLHRGLLVADDVVCGMLSEHIQNIKYTGCLVFDGFPRSVTQAKWLDHFFRVWRKDSSESSHTASLAIQINVTRDQVLRRLSGRRCCLSCGRAYNSHFRPPINFGICDDDGAKLAIRQDDLEHVVLQRLRVHHENTFPLTEYYRRNGQLSEIDGNSTIQAVRAAIACVTRTLEV